MKMLFTPSPILKCDGVNGLNVVRLSVLDLTTSLARGQGGAWSDARN